MQSVVAATTNAAKVGQLAGLLRGVARVVPAPHDISREVGANDIESLADSESIACAKAVAWSAALGDDRLVVATDGGLLIPG